MFGRISILKNLTPEKLFNLRMISNLGSDGDYRPIYSTVQGVARFAKEGGNVTCAVLGNKSLAGYLMICPRELPDSVDSRYRQPLFELCCIEVSRTFRQKGIADRLLKTIFCDPKYQNRIVYLKSYSWTWDLAYNRLDILAYRKMLMALYKKYNFIEYSTNDPNVCLKPENFLMARMGSFLSRSVKDQFRWFRYGLRGTQEI